MRELIDKVRQWHYDRNLVYGTSSEDQLTKLEEEVHELERNVLDNEMPTDDIGDIMVVLILIAEQNGLTIEECLEHAYNEIKDRKGRIVKGIFVKDE